MMYHGEPKERQELLKNKLLNNLPGGRPNERFPVVCTSYEMVVRDSAALSKINWEFIIIVGTPAHLDSHDHTNAVAGRGPPHEEC